MTAFKFALVGCGRICKKHIDAIEAIPDATLVAVCDVDAEKARKASESAGGVPWYERYDDMLRREDVDIVTVLTPSGMHSDQCIDIAQRYKKHVVCEKPMALRLEDADRMVHAFDEEGTRLFVVKQNRYNLPVMRLRQALEEGRFGRIVMGTVRVRWCRPQAYYDNAAWRGTWGQDGGVIANQASHHIDLLEWMLGEPMSVMAVNGTFLVDIEADDTCAALIKFRSGAIGIVEATTATRPKDLEGSLSILGEKGSVVIGGFAVNKLETWNFVDESEAEQKAVLAEFSENPPNIYGYGHTRYLEHVLDCIRNNKRALVDGLEGRRSLELINAMYESTETGREVHLRFQPKQSRLGER